MPATDNAPAVADRIDLRAARLPLVGLLIIACGFTAIGLVMLIAEPGGKPIVAPGSFKQFIAFVAVGFFGLCIPVLLREVLRWGPVVSVSRQGLFDRRLSTDWIPWSAISGLDVFTLYRQRFLRIAVLPDRDAALPWTRRARRIARLNGMYGEGYWLSGQGVAGGIDAVLAAIEQVWHED
ncbi:STM3941 family protein [Methylorubrum aminovorans]